MAFDEKVNEIFKPYNVHLKQLRIQIVNMKDMEI